MDSGKKEEATTTAATATATTAATSGQSSYEVKYPRKPGHTKVPGDVGGSGFFEPHSSSGKPREERKFKEVPVEEEDNDSESECEEIPADKPAGGDEEDFEIPPVKLNNEPAAPPEKKERIGSSLGCEGGSYSSAGMRGYQEDRFAVDDAIAYYAVYDGHGGDKASRYCEKHMKQYVMDKIGAMPDNPTDEDYENAFKQAFIDLDAKFLDKRDDDGSTACVAYVAPNGKSGKLYVANVGDSRAIVVCADHSVVEMSQDHKPDLPAEKKRIEAAYHDVEIVTAIVDGKRIKIARVDGMLAVARAIGDGSLKDMTEPEKCAVTCVPEVRNLQIDPAKHRYAVIACDGIWDVYSNEEVAEIVMDILGDKKKPVGVDELNRVARFIVDGAIEKGSTDNCTAVVVAL